MALDFSIENSGMLNLLFEGSCEQAVDCDITLPDYCPDISRVLKCCVIPGITMSKISGDRACADGNAVVRIIYADEDNNICTYEQNFPFSRFVQLGSDTVGALETDIHVQYTNCRAISKRRIDIHSLLHIIFRISSVTQRTAITRINKSSVQTKTEEIRFSDIIGTECKNISVSEIIELPADYPPVERVVSCYASPVLNEVRVVKDKILIKGETAVTLSYCTGENHGEVICFNHSIPLNQVVEITGISESSLPSVKLKMLDCECNIRHDTNSEPRLIEAGCNILGKIKVYADAQLNCITDSYCIDGSLQPDYERQEFLNLRDRMHEISTRKFTVDLGSLNVQKICSIWWDCVKVNKTLHDGMLSLHCIIPLNIVATDADGKPVFCEREIDFEFKKAVDNSASLITDEAVTPIGFSLGNISDGKIEIKGDFQIEGDIFSIHNMNVLVNADIISNEARSDACIIVYFPEKEEPLWNIARKFNTTVDMIKELNTVQDDLAPDCSPLLIPVK